MADAVFINPPIDGSWELAGAVTKGAQVIAVTPAPPPADFVKVGNGDDEELRDVAGRHSVFVNVDKPMMLRHAAGAPVYFYARSDAYDVRELGRVQPA